MDGYKSLDVAAQQAKYKAGLKGGPFNKAPYTPPAMSIVEGNPSQGESMEQGKVPDQTVTDTWYGRVTQRK